MTQNERLPDEELSEQHEDEDAGSSAAETLTSPFSLIVTCYLVRVDLETADEDDADSHSSNTALFWPGAVELTVTIDLTRPIHAAEQAKEACEGHERLREAIAAYTADHTVEGSWPLDRLPTDAPIAADTDDLVKAAGWVRELIENPLRNAAASAEMPGPLAAMGAGVFATFVTSDITEPIEKAARIINAVSAIIGLLTGMHPLVVACGERWARSMVAVFMQKAVAERMKPTEDVSLRTPEEPGEMTMSAAEIRRAEALGLRPARHGDASPTPDHEPIGEDPRTILLSVDEGPEGDTTGEARSAMDDAV